MNLWLKQRHLSALRKHGFSSIDAGYVTWLSTPPVGVQFTQHVLTFIDAIETAANFVYAFEHRPANALIVGHEAFRFLSMLPQFIPAQRDDVPTIDKCEYVGKLYDRQVWWTRKRVGEDEAVLLGATCQCRIGIRYAH